MAPATALILDSTLTDCRGHPAMSAFWGKADMADLCVHALLTTDY